MNIRKLAAVVAACLIAPATAPADDMKDIQGRWQVLHAESDGKPGDFATLRSTIVTIKGNAHEVHVGDQRVAHGVTFELFADESPKHVIDHFVDRDGKPHKIHSIYHLDGDILMSCSSAVDAPQPPDALAAPAGSGRTFRVLRRLGSPEREQAVDREWKRFEGRWVVRKAESAGQDLTAAFDRHVLTIEPDGRFTYKAPEGTTHGVFVAAPGKEGIPGAIDLVFVDGPQAGKSLSGRYTLSETTYELAVDPATGRRPEGLASGPGSTVVHEILERDPDDASPSP